jgi:hypothetical protein
MVPVRYFPAGKYTVPPPAFEAAAMAFAMDAVALAELSFLAQYFVTS